MMQCHAAQWQNRAGESMTQCEAPCACSCHVSKLRVSTRHHPDVTTRCCSPNSEEHASTEPSASQRKQYESAHKWGHCIPRGVQSSLSQGCLERCNAATRPGKGSMGNSALQPVLRLTICRHGCTGLGPSSRYCSVHATKATMEPSGLDIAGCMHSTLVLRAKGCSITVYQGREVGLTVRDGGWRQLSVRLHNSRRSRHSYTCGFLVLSTFCTLPARLSTPWKDQARQRWPSAGRGCRVRLPSRSQRTEECWLCCTSNLVELGAQVSWPPSAISSGVPRSTQSGVLLESKGCQRHKQRLALSQAAKTSPSGDQHTSLGLRSD